MPSGPWMNAKGDPSLDHLQADTAEKPMGVLRASASATERSPSQPGTALSVAPKAGKVAKYDFPGAKMVWSPRGQVSARTFSS